jgi:hypothetical protein
MDLATTAKLAGTAVKFVEGGPLAEALAELNMNSAISALNKAQNARDKRAQVWSAVNHLESAQSALESKLCGGRGTAQWVLRAHNWDTLRLKRCYVLALMAICYRYLEEEKLAQQAIELGRSSESFRPTGMHWAPWVAGAILGVPTGIVDAPRNDLAAEKYAVNWEQFELPPRELQPRGDGSFL